MDYKELGQTLAADNDAVVLVKEVSFYKYKIIQVGPSLKIILVYGYVIQTLYSGLVVGNTAIMLILFGYTTIMLVLFGNTTIMLVLKKKIEKGMKPFLCQYC